MSRAENGWSRARGTGRVLAAVAFLTLLAGCEPGAAEPPPDAWVEIGTSRVAVEMADTPAKQAQGLGYRDGLEWGDGMYFPYERPAFYSFWMKGMRFSIDIVWIRQERIVDIHSDVPFEPGGNGPTVRPRELADAVLEVPAGYARANGWGVGDRVRLERVNPPKDPPTRTD